MAALRSANTRPKALPASERRILAMVMSLLDILGDIAASSRRVVSSWCRRRVMVAESESMVVLEEDAREQGGTDFIQRRY